MKTNIKTIGIIVSITTALMLGSAAFAVSITGTAVVANQISSSGTILSTATNRKALELSGSPRASTTSSLIQLSNAIQNGSPNGTVIGANPQNFSGNFFDLQINGASKFKVGAEGTVNLPAGAGLFIDGVEYAATGTSSLWSLSGQNIYNTNVDNIGIGTTAPTSKLEVNGNVNLTNSMYVVSGQVGIGTTSPNSLLEVASNGYLQFSKTSSGPPEATDCDNDNERGRLILDSFINRFYVCNGAARGWDYFSLSD